MGFKSILVLLTFLLSLFLSACSGGGGGGGDAAEGLSWSVPTEREDGSALAISDIASYRIYYGLETGIYTGNIDIDHTTTQAQLSSLPSDKYFVVITTIDTDGRESVFSSEVEINNI